MPTSQKSPPRAHPRIALQCDLSQFLVTGDNRDPLRCMGTDVSREGLGIVSFNKLEVDSEVIFQIQGRGIVLKVIWCKQDSTRNNVFHIGLETSDIAVNLVSFLQAEGLVANSPKNSQGEDEALQKKGKGNSETMEDVNFTDLRDTIAKLHTSDQKLLKNSPLEKLATSHKAFPINHKGTSLIVVMPNELRPSAAGKLDEADAAKMIFILKKLGSPMEKVRWLKVWPR